MAGNTAGPIVVGVDGSSSAVQAARWAAAEAAQRNRTLRLVHALDDLGLGYPLPSGTDDVAVMFGRRGQRLLHEARDAVREVAPDVSVEVELSERRTVEALQAESETASLLVLGTTGIRPLGRALVGSVSVALAAHANCPVALIRAHAGDEAPPVDGPVVVGVDGSPAGDAAVALAFDEASWRGVPLVAVHVWDDSLLAALVEEHRMKLERSAVEEHERELLAQRLAGWAEKYPDVEVRRLVQRGRAADELLSVADRAQLIVVGSRGRGGLAGMLLGSTSQTLMSYALCPVVVARAA
ncbi:universal stress protein [Amycolatopsis taiwanensis]|uniref:Universal stress protein n=1 Tax=Amycolatopsis taiwanensis TaxID=342230 RepID=A0A9W6VIQ4_9PSEU|nr:universal stress protein [Amycolatopsis taiwanensis]GLY69935.1 universal stress protein [Amycolatopsis taiwanensis]